MTEWAERIPMNVLPENENYAYHGELERCPCGSSIFRIRAETTKETNKEIEYNWWYICALCGGGQGGWTQHLDLKKEGNSYLLRIDSRGKKIYLKE